jgi:hypothetical protein
MQGAREKSCHEGLSRLQNIHSHKLFVARRGAADSLSLQEMQAQAWGECVGQEGREGWGADWGGEINCAQIVKREAEGGAAKEVGLISGALSLLLAGGQSALSYWRQIIIYLQRVVRRQRDAQTQTCLSPSHSTLAAGRPSADLKLFLHL